MAPSYGYIDEGVDGKPVVLRDKAHMFEELVDKKCERVTTNYEQQGYGLFWVPDDEHFDMMKALIHDYYAFKDWDKPCYKRAHYKREGIIKLCKVLEWDYGHVSRLPDGRFSVQWRDKRVVTQTVADNPNEPKSRFSKRVFRIMIPSHADEQQYEEALRHRPCDMTACRGNMVESYVCSSDDSMTGSPPPSFAKQQMQHHLNMIHQHLHQPTPIPKQTMPEFKGSRQQKRLQQRIWSKKNNNPTHMDAYYNVDHNTIFI